MTPYALAGAKIAHADRAGELLIIVTAVEKEKEASMRDEAGGRVCTQPPEGAVRIAVDGLPRRDGNRR